MTVGVWAFAVYNADGTPKGDGDVSACRSRHEPLGAQEYLWSYEHLAQRLVE